MSQAPTKKLRIMTAEIGNPYSGKYDGQSDGMSLLLNVDMDQLSQNYTVLRMLSGTLTQTAKTKIWSSCKAAYFRTMPNTVESNDYDGGHQITGCIRVVFNDGSRKSGRIQVTIKLSNGVWRGSVVITRGDEKYTINISRKSTFFKEVKLDIDHTEKVIWPIVETYNLSYGKSNRKIDAFSAFEDAGLKLIFKESDCQLIKDPTPNTPWTKADLYEAMMDYFDEMKDSDENIWCMMGTTPPDKRYMGFSFATNGKHGFGLFTRHKSFTGYDSNDVTVRAEANLCLLHYLVHECGHCLDLRHPFEIGAPDSLSWMNYSWKYDELHAPGSFYKSFTYSFSPVELVTLRHSPGQDFRRICNDMALDATSSIGYAVKHNIPDVKYGGEESDSEDGEEGSYLGKRPNQKIQLDLKFLGESFVQGDQVQFEARLKNVGRLPVLVEKDLSLSGGNLKINVIHPDGRVEDVEEFVRPIQSGYTSPLVLYTDDDNEGPDRYSEIVTVGRGKRGLVFKEPGKYTVTGLYRSGKYKVSSAIQAVTIVEANAYNPEVYDQISMAISLGSSGYARFQKVQDYWHELAKQPVEEKRKKISTIIAVGESMVSKHNRQPSKQPRGSKQPKTLLQIAALKDPRSVLVDTEDLLAYMQTKGEKKDNLNYASLVILRCKMYVLLSKTNEAEAEFNQMLVHLVQRRVKYDVISSLSKTWTKIKNPKPREDKFTPENLQKRVTEVLSWVPPTEGNGEPDLSDIGLGRPFNIFDRKSIIKGSKIIRMLFTKYDETKDMIATIKYADNLQKSRKLNYKVLQWAFEAFIVHSMDAKKAGIKYPEPEQADASFTSDAAMISTQRTGNPTEEWMNYWRCDGDLNYHHRHWHTVYVLSSFISADRGSTQPFTQAPPHLRRQGELFGYMHAQMLARYNAERESWGLPTTQAWHFEDAAMTFNAGLEFHSESSNRFFAPRSTERWPRNAITRLREMETAYARSVRQGVISNTNIELTPDWAGHVLENSSDVYASIYGNLHNTGHGVFGSMVPRGTSGYMNTPATAMRDPIFYRWHTYIDELWQSNNDYYRSEVDDAPPVTINSGDVIIDSNRRPPNDFNAWNGDWVSPGSNEDKTIHTTLGPPTKRFEWDYKITHERFFYHIRVKRNSGTPISDPLELTFRIFIVPRNHQNNRRRFIEMDKFVYRLDAGVDHAVLTRADYHSSVIKRVPSETQDDIERQFIRESRGFCECGWPLSMLLPRGNDNGEFYMLYVIATDNNIDALKIRTGCGSLSFCGSQGEEYPDSRNMGYPFSSPIAVGGQAVSIPEAFDSITNGTRKQFLIKNNITSPNLINARDIWYPHLQLNLSDGTLRGDATIDNFRLSSWTGRFRVLIDDNAASSSQGRPIILKFQGRGIGGGPYVVRDVMIGLRSGNTLNETLSTPVLFRGESRFTIPEAGTMTDPLLFNFDPALGDHFVTFTLETPGVYLRPLTNSATLLTYRIADFASVKSSDTDWDRLTISNRSLSLYCLSGIMAEI